MTAWQYLNLKGVGATAFAILLASITASNTWDALLQKSSAPTGSTAWVHLVSVLDDVEVQPGGGGGISVTAWDQATEEDLLLLKIIDRVIRNPKGM